MHSPGLAHHAALFALVLVFPFVGCVGSSGADVEGAQESAADSIVPEPLDLSGERCWLGGGHSVLPKYDWLLPEPWEPADVLDDVGPQAAYSGGVSGDFSQPVPTEGRTMGNWHATFVCEGWTLRGEGKPGALVGFVGARVEPPPFDAGTPASHHYLVTVVASDDEDVRAAFTAGGVHAMPATHARTTLLGSVERIQMWTRDNGDYDSLFSPTSLGAMDASRLRLWFQASTDGQDHVHADPDGPEWRASGAFRPLAIDVVVEKPGTHIVAEATGYFSHAAPNHHNGLPGTANSAALLYEDIDARIEWGARPDVILEAAYVH